MNFCPKCHKKMRVGEGNVFFKIGDTEIKTVSVIYSCEGCGKHSANFQFRVEPIQAIETQEAEKDKFNA